MLGNNSKEIEVFRLYNFSKDKDYEFALKTRTEGLWPQERHFTTNPLQYVGRYDRSERWGWGDGSGGAEIFILKGKEVRIILDYEGNSCFREVFRAGPTGSTGQSSQASIIGPTGPKIDYDDTKGPTGPKIDYDDTKGPTGPTGLSQQPSGIVLEDIKVKEKRYCVIS
jgi:hypothetical protein